MLNRYAPFISALVICLVYGMAAQKYQWFPAPQLYFMAKQAQLALGEVSGDNDWYYVDGKGRLTVDHYQADKVQPGLTLISGIDDGHQLMIKVVDFDGAVVHHWPIEWDQLWPEANHIPEHLMPKGKPGTHIHGTKLMDNGDVVFNFENLGLVRLDACGEVVFKLPYPTHHAVETDDDGLLWLPGQVYHQQKLVDFPNYIPPFKDDTVVTVSQEGKLLSELSIMQLLADNGYAGLMYLSTIRSRDTSVSGDVYHLNDVEIFPRHMREGVFKHGDVMVSLRNINTVLVYDPNTLKIRYLSTGKFVRQHDPDFIDGNRISVYDNNHIGPASFAQNSKIVILSAVDGSISNYLNDDQTLAFYSNIMGKHQWLDNGNLLIVESMNGRILEVNPDKRLVWQYNNLIAQKGVVGIMESAERLASSYDRAFFQQQLAKCQAN